MKLALHIFRKDARRLWPAILLAQILLASLAVNDRWRGDSIVGTTEGWLNLLLPLAWACLLAFAVLEEPQTGDRHFWLTRPHRWPVLLGAKLLFALAFVHLPSLLAAIYIVTARGFTIAECAADLLAQQATLAAAVTVPAMAIAALAGSFTHFMTLLFAVAAAAVAVSGAVFRTVPRFERPVDYLRPEFVAVVFGLGALAVVLLQYRRRGLRVAQAVALLTAVLAGGLYGYVPERVDYKVRATLHPAAAMTLQLSTGKATLPAYRVPLNTVTVAIPVALSGVNEDALFRLGHLDLVLETPDGARIGDSQLGFSEVQRYPGDLPAAPRFLVLHLEPRLYAQLKQHKLRISGHLPASFFRMGQTSWMPVGSRVAAPGVGHCSATPAEDRWGINNIVKVLCESPSHLPRHTMVTVAIPSVGKQWYQGLFDSGNFTDGPRWAWLSPLERGKTFVHTSDPSTRMYDYSMEIPLEHLEDARIGITPEIPTGYTLIDFDFRDVVLSDFYVKPYARR